VYFPNGAHRFEPIHFWHHDVHKNAVYAGSFDKHVDTIFAILA
jgi:hypothetical protein